jgi:hypothetical protein
LVPVGEASGYFGRTCAAKVRHHQPPGGLGKALVTHPERERPLLAEDPLTQDGTTHVIFEPMDFLVRLAALVPKPRVNLTLNNGVFAPNSRYRARVTKALRG